MFKRTISSVIGAPIFLGLTYLGGPYTAFLVAVLTLLSLHEFLLIGELMGIKAWHKLTTIATVVYLTSLFLGGKAWMFPIFIVWILVVLGRLALSYPKTSLAEASINLLAVLYTVVMFSHLYLLRLLPHGIEWAFFTIFMVWATDTGAYLIGGQFGRHLLAPQISPKKTVEGSLGGLLLSIAVSIAFWRIVGGASGIFYISLGVVIGIGAQVGDLFESTLKRSAGVKDSGKIIPGHGGVLDRFDSLLFALPLVYYGVILLS